MDIKLITPPDRFVGFHGHTGFSVFDGLGYPSDHIDFVLKNGMDAWALTDHGNGSGLAHAYKHAEKVKKQYGWKKLTQKRLEWFINKSLLEYIEDNTKLLDAIKDKK